MLLAKLLNRYNFKFWKREHQISGAKMVAGKEKFLEMPWEHEQVIGVLFQYFAF